jgi:hypothetical protein
MREAILAACLTLAFAAPTFAAVEFKEIEPDGTQVFLVTGPDCANVLRTGKLVVWRGPQKSNGLYSVRYLQTRSENPLNAVIRRGAYPDGEEWYTLRFLPGNLHGEQSVDGEIRAAGSSPNNAGLKGKRFNWV